MPDIVHLVVIAIVLVTIWLIFCVVAEPSPKVRQVGNYVLMAIFAIIAIRILVAFI